MKTISSRGLTEKDQLVLKSLIDLVINRTRYSWSYTESNPGDVAIIDADNLESPGDAFHQLRGQQVIVVAYGDGAVSDHTPFRIPKPIRAATLIAAINAIESSLEAGEDKDDGGTGQPAAPESRQANEQPATRHLNNLGKSGLHIKAGNLECLVDPTGNRYRITAGHSLEELLAQPDKTLEAATSTKGHDGLADWHSSPSLRWKLGIALSAGELVNNLHIGSRFKLLRWPPTDVTRSASHILNLCSLLSRKSGASVEEITSRSAVPRADTIAFINGAALAGALSVRAFGAAEQPAPQPRPEPQPKGLFEKIRDRLKRKPK